MPKRGMTNKTTTISLTLRGLALLNRIATELGIDCSDLLELLLRDKADSMGIPWQDVTLKELETGSTAEVLEHIPMDRVRYEEVSQDR